MATSVVFVFVVVVVVVAALVLVAVVQAADADPPRPVIRELFETDFTLRDKPHSMQVVGNGTWAVNGPANLAMEHIKYSSKDTKKHDVYVLARGDLNQSYIASDEDGHVNCARSPMSGAIIPVWEWLATAEFVGTEKLHSQSYNKWQLKRVWGVFTVWVNETHANVPVMFQTDISTTVTNFHFHHFRATTPNPKIFEVPSFCPQ